MEVEWDVPPPGEDSAVPPEQQEGLRGLLAELLFSLVGVPVFGFAAACLRPPLRLPGASAAALPVRADWEVWVYRWLPLVLLGLAFACAVWSVVVVLRLGARMRKGGGT
jgi:hypothetical protein